MKRSQDEQLDRLLSDWASKTATGKAAREALRKAIYRVSDEVETPPVVELASLWQQRRSRWRVVTGITAATVAVLLLGVGMWYRSELDPTAGGGRKSMTLVDQSRQASPPPLNADVSADHLRRLWQEHYRLFGARLSWLADRGDHTEIGLSEPVIQSSSNDLVGIELVLWSRSTVDGKWQKVQALRVLAGPEHLVQVPSDEGTSEPLAIWAYPLDEEMVSIDLSFRPNLPGAPKFNQSMLQRLGEHTQIGDFEKDGIEYRLYQAADLIPSGKLG